jgi:nicotinamide-nucleotide adenylyltransferase
MDPAELAAIVNRLSQVERPALHFTHRAAVTGSGTVGILSASFNPLTRAHTAMLEFSQQKFGFSEWLLVLSLANVDKQITGLALASRLQLLHLWARARPQVSVALCSHGRFVEKHQAVRDVRPGRRLLFLLGYDTLIRLFDDRYYADMAADLQTLFADCEIVAMNRGQATTQAIREFLARPDVAPFARRIHAVELPEPYCQISSTQVRNLMSAGESVEGLVPEEFAGIQSQSLVLR